MTRDKQAPQSNNDCYNCVIRKPLQVVTARQAEGQNHPFTPKDNRDYRNDNRLGSGVRPFYDKITVPADINHLL